MKRNRRLLAEVSIFTSTISRDVALAFIILRHKFHIVTLSISLSYNFSPTSFIRESRDRRSKGPKLQMQND